METSQLVQGSDGTEPHDGRDSGGSEQDGLYDSSRYTCEDYDKTTSETFQASEAKFYGAYAEFRKKLDYLKYHVHYRKERQWLHDSIIEDVRSRVSAAAPSEACAATRPLVVSNRASSRFSRGMPATMGPTKVWICHLPASARIPG